MTLFNEHDHARLATLFDSRSEIDRHGDLCATSDNYPGYTPEVREAPNGDTKACLACVGQSRADLRPSCPACQSSGRVPNVDAGPAGKRYLHVALKYNPPGWALEYLARAHFMACQVAERIGVPAEYYPRVEDGTLRVVEYPSAGHKRVGTAGAELCMHCRNDWDYCDPCAVCPILAPGAGTAEHTDFDLFTIVLWRSTPEDLELHHRTDSTADTLRHAEAHRLSPGLHIGEIGELVGLGPATPHRVPARPYVQKSIVYFAMPDHGARLPEPVCRVHYPFGCTCTRSPTAGEWLKERLKRSRYK